MAGVSQSGNQEAGELFSGGQCSQGVGGLGNERLDGLQPVARQGLQFGGGYIPIPQRGERPFID